VAMVKLFWLCVLIVLSITAFLVSDSMAILQFPIGARRHGKLQKRNKQQRNKFHRQVPSVACPGPQCKRGVKGRIMNRFTKEDKELS